MHQQKGETYYGYWTTVVRDLDTKLPFALFRYISCCAKMNHGADIILYQRDKRNLN